MMLALDFALLDVRRFSSSHADAEINITIKWWSSLGKVLVTPVDCKLSQIWAENNIAGKRHEGRRTREIRDHSQSAASE